jgi:hypothetical protein
VSPPREDSIQLISFPFIEPEVSTLFSKDPSIGNYPEPVANSAFYLFEDPLISMRSNWLLRFRSSDWKFV